MSITPAPAAVTQKVNEYLTSEQMAVAKYDNREYLDHSGRYSLHMVAREIYALAWEDGYRAANEQAYSDRHFEREGRET